ncbi:aminotransferase class I/II-fold pyridoxal phosphate-dependent enzyme [Corynebacterium sp. MNWGS58]|uniref:aminotransferase class I/II-fold pyridoxal phosphate-dependent enzyme n=1 Tax=Corynebacterium sp. 102791.4 TaxID=3104612 RepID=UPI0035121AC6
MKLDELASARIAQWEKQGLLRHPAEFTGPQNPRAHLHGVPKPRVLLSSSNYLGLSTHPEVIAAARDALEEFGTGSGGSRLTTGSTSWHRHVEKRFAEFVGFEQAVLFGTGYQANISILQTLASENLTIFSDSLNHASLIDGIRLANASGAAKVIFPHLDYARLEQELASCRSEHKLVVSDGVFSMDGDIADLRVLRELCDHHGAWLLVDDAHGVGTVGKHGVGASELYDARPDILVGTASKALGAEGGFIACSAPVAHMLRNQARGYVYSTACSAANCAAISAALEIVQRPLDDAHPVVRLHERVAALRAASGYGVEGAGAGTVAGQYSPIIPFAVGAESAAMELASGLAEKGFHVPAIRYPTVARGQAILRTTAMASLDVADIAEFGKTIRGLGWNPPKTS